MPAILEREVLYENLTYADYFTLPELHCRYDIIDGRLIVSPSPELDHQLESFDLARLLDDHVRSRRLGIVVPAPFDVLISREPLRCRQPDALFVSFSRLGVSSRKEARRSTTRPLEVPPELVVEILSPSEDRAAVAEKLTDYATIGVDEVWLVSPQAETIEVLRLTSGQYERLRICGVGENVESTVFPDSRLAVDAVFD